MKDFVKWLGVNEKIAKVVVWLLIIMVTLIIFNTAMESIGFPYYAVTYNNIKSFKYNIVLEYLTNWIILILNFYSTILLVFRAKEAKNIFKYALLYLAINIILSLFLSPLIMHIFIIGWIIVFCYFYSEKQYKYMAYGVIALTINTVVQGIAYFYKVRFIDYSKLNYTTKSLLSFDYFIIIAIIILVKEIYLNKRSEDNVTRTRNLLAMVGQIQQRRTTSKKTSKKSSKSS